MLSNPNRVANATNATNATRSTTASRTRISAVVSCRRTSRSPRRIERPARSTTNAVTATIAAKAASSTTFAPALPPELEKKNERMTGEVSDRRSGDGGLTDRARSLAGVLQHRDDQAQRRRRQRPASRKG